MANKQQTSWQEAFLSIYSPDLSRTEAGYDSYIQNGMIEVINEMGSDKGQSYVVPRSSFSISDALTNKTGVFRHSYYPYYALGASIYKQADGGSASTVWTGTNTTAESGKFTNIRDTENKRDQLIFVEGDTGVMVSINKSTGVATEITAAPVPANPHVTELDGYLFAILEGSDEIYNSDLNDTTSWNLSINFIRSSAYPGNLTALTTYKNYLVAFKAESMEFFYDAGLSGTSPIQRHDSLRANIGCAYPYTIAKAEDSLFWVGQGSSGQTPSVYMMVGSQPQRISNPGVERQLTSLFESYDKEGDYRGWVVREGGHTLYILKTPTTTFYYDINMKVWGYFSYKNGTQVSIFDPFDPPEETTLGPYFYWYDGSNTYLGHWTSTISQYDSYLGTNYPIIVQLETPPIDLETMRRKVLSLMRLRGSIRAGYNFRVRWTDDDGTTWSNWHGWSIGTNPTLRNLGQFRRRKFQFEFINVDVESPSTRLTTNPSSLRFEGFELEYRLGVN